LGKELDLKHSQCEDPSLVPNLTSFSINSQCSY